MEMGTARDKALQEALGDIFGGDKPDKKVLEKIKMFLILSKLRVGIIVVTFLYVYWWFLYG